ncbi:MAG: amino acid ABC transporter substrate-binding protein [Lewinellaceae bacterium]|nr:amino acid ABC transporter substrate-binding protein [Lewinellaceae bacterium]
MISVQSHRQRLSGNREWTFMFMIFLLMASCTPLKKTPTKKPDIQVVKPDIPDKKGQETTPPKPQKTDQPSHQKDIVVKDVDTLHLKENTTKTPPIKSKNDKDAVFTEGLDMKSSYHIKLLIPLNSDAGLVQGNQLRFVHFYAGVLKALEVLDDQRLKFLVDVIDTEEGGYNLRSKIDDILSDDTDLVIGPFEKDDVKELAEAAKKKGIPIMSPWQTSTKIASENPWYVQLKPNLKEHFNKLTQACIYDFHQGEVAIVGKDNKETRAWIEYFQNTAKNLTNNKKEPFFTSYFVSNDSLINAPSAFFRLLSNPKIKAVLLPNYSFSDEEFVYGVLRRLMAEKGSKQVVVYGMPLLIESEKIDFDFYHALNLRIALSDYLDLNSEEIREFRREFLDLYGEIPLSDAVKGYSIMMLAANSLHSYGTHFQNYIVNKDMTFLQTTFNIEKSVSEDKETDMNNTKDFDYFENKHLDIVEFKGTGFVKRF